VHLISELRSEFAVGNFHLASCCSLSVIVAAHFSCPQGLASGGISVLIRPLSRLIVRGSAKINRECSRLTEAIASSSKFGIATAV